MNKRAILYVHYYFMDISYTYFHLQNMIFKYQNILYFCC